MNFEIVESQKSVTKLKKKLTTEFIKAKNGKSPFAKPAK